MLLRASIDRGLWYQSTVGANVIKSWLEGLITFGQFLGRSFAKSCPSVDFCTVLMKTWRRMLPQSSKIWSPRACWNSLIFNESFFMILTTVSFARMIALDPCWLITSQTIESVSTSPPFLGWYDTKSHWTGSHCRSSTWSRSNHEVSQGMQSFVHSTLKNERGNET